MGTWSWCSTMFTGMAVFLAISMISCGWRVGMEYFDHKVLLHPRRAGANASRCWLPVQYGEANALDTSHRSSHHPLKRGSQRAITCFHPRGGCHHPDWHRSSAVVLEWANFLSASHCRHSMGFEASQSANMSACGAVGSCTPSSKKWEGWKICY